MALEVYPIVMDPNTSSSRVFDPNSDILVINQLAVSDNDVIPLKFLSDVKGLIYANSSDTTLGYLEDKVNGNFFEIDSSTLLSIKDKAISADQIADDVDVSSRGFNADKIDGYHASEFARLTENNTFSGKTTFDADVTFNEDVEIQGETYTNYAKTLLYHGSIVQLNYDQGANVPTLTGIEILNGSSDPTYFIGYSNQDSVFVVYDVTNSELMNIRVAEPVNAYDAVNKLYLEKELADISTSDFLRTDGSNKMESDMDINNNSIINVADPTNDQDAATKKYVDDQISSVGTTYKLGNKSESTPDNPTSTTVEICDIPKNTFVVNVALTIATAFDNTEITGIEVGDNTHPAILMTVSENDPFAANTYVSWPYQYYTSDDKVILHFVGGIPSTGKAYVFVQFSE